MISSDHLLVTSEKIPRANESARATSASGGSALIYCLVPTAPSIVLQQQIRELLRRCGSSVKNKQPPPCLTVVWIPEGAAVAAAHDATTAPRTRPAGESVDGRADQRRIRRVLDSRRGSSASTRVSRCGIHSGYTRRPEDALAQDQQFLSAQGLAPAALGVEGLIAQHGTAGGLN